MLPALVQCQGIAPVTVEGKRLPGKIHLLQLLLVTPAAVLNCQIDIAGVGAGGIAEDPGCCLPSGNAHLLSLQQRVISQLVASLRYSHTVTAGMSVKRFRQFVTVAGRLVMADL